MAGTCGKCGGPRDSKQHYCKACFAAYARQRRQTLASAGKRCWTNSMRDRENVTHHFFGPTWLAPRTVPKMIATITASIVWGMCGKMADVPDY